MSVAFTAEELSSWLGVEWQGAPPAEPVSGISIDTRTLQPGQLYAAVCGERFDGHGFIEKARAAGAAGALVSRPVAGTGLPLLQVRDTVEGLQQLARGYRAVWDAAVIGITGSAGKTTVKELLAEVLALAGPTHRTAGNYNNHIGLPLSMLSMPRDARYGVLEIGMNHPGEIAPLAGMLRPDAGMVTEVGNAHREAFDSVRAIAEEKAELLRVVGRDGFAVLDADSEWAAVLAQGVRSRVIRVSLQGAGDVNGTAEPDGRLRVDGFVYTLPRPGRYMMRNALKVIATARTLGIDTETVQAGLQRYAPPAMRWEALELDGIHFINDAYNANPLSMRAGLETLAALPGDGRRWAVLGGMFELGDTAGGEHAALGTFINSLPLDGVITVGPLGKQIRCDAVPVLVHAADVEEAAGLMKELLRPGDRVLLKASRGERLERVLAPFQEIK